jgi:hypothetical protein
MTKRVSSRPAGYTVRSRNKIPYAGLELTNCEKKKIYIYTGCFSEIIPALKFITVLNGVKTAAIVVAALK